MKYKHYRDAKSEDVPDSDYAEVLEAKRNIWRKHGWVTHNDAAYIASKILRLPERGRAIRESLVRRFPFVVVDELQDTGYFLGKCLLSLLNETAIRGVLVGDPDQAIYEFNGARPDLFESYTCLPGATVLPLAKSRRCPNSVTACASEVKDSPGSIIPSDGKGGNAYILQYDEMTSDVRRLAKTLSGLRPGSVIKVITRHQKTVDDLVALNAETADSLHCPSINHLFRAVKAFRQGRNSRALASAKAALDLAVFSREGVSNSMLSDAKIDQNAWKRASVLCVMKCNGIPSSGTYYEWQESAGKILDDAIVSIIPESLGYQIGKAKPKKINKIWDIGVSKLLPNNAVAQTPMGDVPVLTVHGVKGETHDITVFVCPPQSRADRCPSAQWWPSAEEGREERRIAYVAMTRSRGDLILCMSQECRSRFAKVRPSFLSNFQELTLDGIISRIGESGASC